MKSLKLVILPTTRHTDVPSSDETSFLNQATQPSQATRDNETKTNTDESVIYNAKKEEENNHFSHEKNHDDNDSFVTTIKYSYKDLCNLHTSVFARSSNKKFLTLPFFEIISSHFRFLLEVFLNNAPIEEADVLFWISKSFDQHSFEALSKVVEKISDSKLRTYLLKLKRFVITELIDYLSDVVQTEKQQEHFELIRERLLEINQQLSTETFHAFKYYLEEHNEDSCHLKQFIRETIEHKPRLKHDTSYLLTSHIYKAFLQWCTDKGLNEEKLFAGDRGFGKALAAYLRQAEDNEGWDFSLVGGQTRHYNIRIKQRT